MPGAAEFRDAFLDVMIRHPRNVAKLDQLWQLSWSDAWTDAPYTNFIESTVYPQLADRLEMHVNCHACGGQIGLIDAVFCDDSGKELIALEHENKPSSASEEVTKLARFGHALKVLITYPAKSKWSAYLNQYSAKVAASSHAHPSEFLIVFAPMAKNSPIAAEDWCFFTFSDGRFSNQI